MVEIENESEKKYKYDVFISYRHIEPDLTIAKILHEMIEKFNIPKHLRTASNEENSIDDKHVFRVFRDREELSTKDLSTMIEEAIANSKNLIVICSKRTSLSPWCRKEVQLFKKIHGVNNIIPVLIEGEPDEAFIDELKNLKATFINSENVEEEKNIELLAADIRPDEVKSPAFKGYEILENSKDPKLNKLTKKSLDILKKSEIYRIVASMLNVNYGDLKLRHQERYLKRIIYTSVAASIAMLIKYPNITVFGELIDVLNFEAITNEPLEVKAKEFNAYYKEISGKIMNSPEENISIEEQWNSLSNIKKDSSRNQCIHQNVKEVLLEKIAQMEGFSSVEELLDRWKAIINSVSLKEQIDIIEKNPAMNYMSALEHKRWSNFYYMRNFIYSEKKDEVNCTHNSLIDDWDEFLHSDKREEVIYDFISVLSVK